MKPSQVKRNCGLYESVSGRGRLRTLTILLLFAYVLTSDVGQARIQDWERTCVVGECVRASSAFQSCLAQPLEVKLGHPTKKDVRSEPIFRNRPNALAVESCTKSVGSDRGNYRHTNDGRGRRQAHGDGFIPICCPEKKTEEGMLIAGLGAGTNEFPHQVRLLIRSPTGTREKCGGTIYNREYILTAASCLVYNGKMVSHSDVEVISGQNMEHTRVDGNIHAVRDIKIHEGYKGTLHDYGRDHDIALLHLRDHLDFSSHRGSTSLKALRIPEKGFRADGRPAIILGWGRTALEEKPIGSLLKMNAHINTHDECSEKSRAAIFNGNDMRKTKLEQETPHDEFGDPDIFELSKSHDASSSRSNDKGRSSFFDRGFSDRRRRSSFDSEFGDRHLSSFDSGFGDRHRSSFDTGFGERHRSSSSSSSSFSTGFGDRSASASNNEDSRFGSFGSGFGDRSASASNNEDSRFGSFGSGFGERSASTSKNDDGRFGSFGSGFGDRSFDSGFGERHRSSSSSSSSRSSSSSFGTGFGDRSTSASNKEDSRFGSFGSDFGRKHSIFDSDDFFKNWDRGSSLSNWHEQHEFVNMGALQLGKLWEGGAEYKNQRGSFAHTLRSFPSNLLCIGGGAKSTGYNRGDSGGPAICEGAGGFPVLCGISSYGRNEFRGEWPATYVNVAHYADWIHSNTGRSRQSEETLVKDVIDGEPLSSPDEASFFMRIHNKKTNTTCGGALINSKTVISSVSCVPLDVRTDDLLVTSGEYSVGQKGTEHDVDGVSSKETYKNYQSRSHGRKGGSSEKPGSGLKGDFPQLNLAVLKLSKPVRDAKPIDLIKPRMERMIVHEYGWRTDRRDKTMNRWAYREVSSDECKARYGAVGIQVDENHLCAAETYGGGERCNKELGNPLVCMDRHGKKYLCGVTSIRDCHYAFPTIFTNIVKNLDWIQL